MRGAQQCPVIKTLLKVIYWCWWLAELSVSLDRTYMFDQFSISAELALRTHDILGIDMCFQRVTKL